MKYGRVMIAAPKSGSGKTIITCGLLTWLKDRGFNVCSYKCGPDYIDPMFHRQVIGVPGENLDTFFSGREEIRARIAASGSDSAVIEGVMGIYDGVTGESGAGSCYDAAYVTDTPILLVIDVKGMGQTMLSVIKGILLDDKHCLIRGIALNRISERYYGMMKPHIDKVLEEISCERGVSVRLAGGLPDVRGFRLESRHLGLMMPEEIDDLTEQVTAARNLIAENLDTHMLLEIMSCAGDLSDEQAQNGKPAELTESPRQQVTLAVARDEAFCFYYEENLRMLRQYGIRIEEFSPVCGRRFPEDADGILLGGGYPELHAEELSGNELMREQIRAAIEGGMPCLAECGGFMYLMDDITDEEGVKHPMCGVIRGSSHNTGRLGRFGYVEVSASGDNAAGSLISGLSIRGHEFHYYDSDNNGSDAVAVKPGTGRSWECMHADENSLIGYPHLYYPSCPELVMRFRERMEKYRLIRLHRANQQAEQVREE